MLDYNSVLILIAVIVTIACFAVTCLFIYTHRKRNAIIIDELRTLKNRAEIEEHKTDSQLDREIFKAYRRAYSRAISLVQRGML